MTLSLRFYRNILSPYILFFFAANAFSADNFEYHHAGKDLWRSNTLSSVPAVSSVDSSINILPQPLDVKRTAGNFRIDKNTVVSGNLSAESRLLIGILANSFGLDLRTGNPSENNFIELRLDNSSSDRLGSEGYYLQVRNDKIQITAPTTAGIFYGIQSLRQLIKNDDGVYSIPCLEITDRPRFSWRAFMLDESRYFKGEDQVKKLLDEMAMLKMNVFHWHLTDDQGWRIEIKKYPLLTEIGSKRDSTQIGDRDWNSNKYDGKPHAGFYTQEQIKNIIDYARERHIVIVPEIEMPGHSRAAIASYPWLGVTKKQIKVPVKFGVGEDVFDVTDPRVMQFLEDVLNEVMTLFPSNVIHIGGDEVKYEHWKADEGVKEYMKKKGLISPADLQIEFTNRISHYLDGKNRRMMGWNDIIGSAVDYFTKPADKSVSQDLSKSTIVHFWVGSPELVNKAVSKGHDVVNSFHEFTYLDYAYDYTSLEKAYSFDPIPEGLDSKYHNKILGLGCQMWGEWIPTVKSMDKQIFPRIAAYAEVGWSPREKKNFDHFKQSIRFFYGHWKEAGIDYHE